MLVDSNILIYAANQSAPEIEHMSTLTIQLPEQAACRIALFVVRPASNAIES